MSSIEHTVLIEGRSASHTATDNVVRFQQTNDPASSSSSPLPTPRIQQATISQSQQFTIPLDITSTSDSTMPTTMSEPATPPQEKHGLSSRSIAGLAMIPVAMILITMAIFAYFFWLRKRRRQGPIIRHLGPTPPPAVPEKDFGSPASSFESTTSGGKVRSMTAMSTPVAHTGWVASSRPQPRPSNDSAVHHNPWHDQLPRISADITAAGLQVPRGGMGAGNDSPIDRSSPFRLKRGDTRKRSSLDADIMSAWPAPPQPVAQPVTLQPAPLQPCTGRTYMERRSISAEYFAQERNGRDARGAQEYWENIRLELGPDPGPTAKW